MQIAIAAKASKELPLEGSCSHHTAKCPAWKGCGRPAEKHREQLCQPPAPGASCGTAREGRCSRAPRERWSV